LRFSQYRDTLAFVVPHPIRRIAVMPKATPTPQVIIQPYDVQVEPTALGVRITAVTKDTTYMIDLPWNGWVSVLLKAMADVVAAKLHK